MRAFFVLKILMGPISAPGALPTQTPAPGQWVARKKGEMAFSGPLSSSQMYHFTNFAVFMRLFQVSDTQNSLYSVNYGPAGAQMHSSVHIKRYICLYLLWRALCLYTGLRCYVNVLLIFHAKPVFAHKDPNIGVNLVANSHLSQHILY